MQSKVPYFAAFILIGAMLGFRLFRIRLNSGMEATSRSPVS